ncbi:MAG: hypothetical protein ABWK53_07855 [Anaerolineales bacterium]
MKSALFKLASLSVVLILILTACRLPNATTPEPVTPTPAEPASTEVPAPETLPTGFTDLLEAKVASGEWTYEEGLVILLKLFAGEIQAAEASLGPGVLEAEGSGVLDLAIEYLQTGTDQAVKAEITRLLNILVPSQAVLDQYSIPAEQASRRPPGVAAPLRQELNCATLWANGFPDNRDPSFRCFMHGGGEVAGQQFRVYYPLEWRDDARLIGYYEITLDAAAASLNTYRAYGEIRPIYFVFTQRDHIENPVTTLAVASWSHFQPGEACPVIIYPRAFELHRPEFQQIIAHEIFHCFEAWNLRDQGIGAGYTSSKWWVEGAAEYFSNVVYPSVNYEYRFAASLSSRSNTEPLTSMTYENFAFFQFLGNRSGPAGVIAFLRQMPVVSGIDHQLSALSGVPGIEDTWEEFARALFDATLLDSDGSVANIPLSYTTEFRFAEAGSTTLSGKPFVLARHRLIFTEEQEFPVSVTTAGPGRSAARLSGTRDPWLPLPATIAACGEAGYLVYTLTTTVGAERTETVTVAPPTEHPCDRCVVGQWRSTPESVLAYFRSIIAQTGDGSASVYVEEVSGAMVAEFRTDGMAVAGYDNLVVHQVVTGSGVLGGPAIETDMFISFSGTSSGRYTADGTNITGSGPGTGIVVTVDTYVNNQFMGTNTLPIRPEDFPAGAPLPTRYTCSGNTLTMWPPVSGVPNVAPIEYRRVSP